MASILPNDTELHFPNFILVPASAGSGKTHTLTLKLLQLLLSDHAPNNSLTNILAMTFTKNAASEMKGRLLAYLKKAHFGNEEILCQLQEVVSSDKERLQNKAGRVVDEILDNYSDLHIQTIDSFLTRIFKSSALEYGFTPQTEIILDPQALINEAFDRLVREMARSKEGKKLLEQLVNKIIDAQKADSSFIWNPYVKLREEVTTLFNFLTTQAHDLAKFEDRTDELDQIRREATAVIKELTALVQQSGFEPQKWFVEIVESVKLGDIESVILKNLAKSLIKKTSKRSAGPQGALEDWLERFAPFQQQISSLSERFVIIKAQMFYQPYVEMHEMLLRTMDVIKRREGKISIGEISKNLAGYLRSDIVPEIYYNLGENIFHYLIDEFQDTSPVQWENMYPLLENALSQKGSLFIVGDTKQSIFTFRGADWRIMKRLMERQEFPSVETEVRNLETNHRSAERILQFNEDVFHDIMPKQVDDGAAHASGLSDYKQNVNPKFEGKGYVELTSLENSGDDNIERAKLLEIIKDCKDRGVAYSDIAVITPKNTDVVQVSGWLNEEGIDFISHSSLDVRARKLSGEIISLLKFLDSPIDNLSFANFILGNIFQRIIQQSNTRLSVNDTREFIFKSTGIKKNKHPLYSVFRMHYPLLWDKYFAELYRLVGYLPIYDLVSAAYKIFHLFELFPEEEATLAKILDVINKFEENGQNSLSDFLSFAEEEIDEGEWNIDIPADLNAVSVMTIHKAKGLGFRVVIVLLYDSRRRYNNLFTEETDEGIRLYRITQSDLERAASLNILYQEQRLREHVDDLNKLYVALTRAQEEMYVLSVKSKYANEPSCYLPQTGYESSQKPIIEKEEHKKEQRAEIIHSTALFLQSLILADRLKRKERRRGDFIHAVLARIVEIEPNIETQIASMMQIVEEEMSLSADDSSICKTIVEFLSLPQIQKWFVTKPNRRVLNEQEFTSNAGQLFRMDRVIVDEDTVTVIDFKTGDEKEGYQEQIDGYKKILLEVFPDKKVQGALAYVDKKIITWIE